MAKRLRRPETKGRLKQNTSGMAVQNQRMEDDLRFMREAFKLARQAFEAGEVPVGAVVVADGRIIGKGYNLTETLHDATAHAEMQAFTAAAEYLGGKYLTDCTLYVTLEPCCMCAGAAYWTQISRIVYGADDPKRGCSRVRPSLLHPKTVCEGGLMAEESRALLQAFFNEIR